MNKDKYGEIIISWKAPEFQKVKRGKYWIFSISFFAILLLSFSIWQGTYPFAIVIILFGIIYFLTHNHEPKIIDIGLTNNGVIFGDRFYSHSEISNFWILFDPSQNLKKLHILVNKELVKNITIELDNQDPSEIRSFLSIHIPEIENKTEGFLDKMIRTLKL